MTIEEFDALPSGAAVTALLECCSSRVWAERVAAARPFGTAAALQDAAARALAELDEDGIDAALAGHPRIGERSPEASSQHASSRREQAGVIGADAAVLAALAAGNREYEERFGHVYLVCADGRPAAELLAVLRERLRHDPGTERAAVRTELGTINAIRLARMLGER